LLTPIDFYIVNFENGMSRKFIANLVFLKYNLLENGDENLLKWVA
jgi:hypothetical protein